MMRLFAILIFAIIPIAHASGNLEAGSKLAIPCMACHGPQGNSVMPLWPSLAGQNQTYFIKQMLDFKNGKRVDPIMQPVAATLSVQDINNLAAYFSAQHPTANPTKIPTNDLGRQIYRGGIRAQEIPACAACHSPFGRGNAQAGFPLLAGQSAQYILLELNAFKAGQRPGVKEIMHTITNRMTPEQMQAVATYIESLSNR